jgi:4-aminobutyrate aminotransferase-like enzyme
MNRPLLSTSLTAGQAAVPHVVGGDGAYFVLADGRRVLDASNTAAPLGHAHPKIVEAIRRTATAPVVNEGWRWTEREQAAEALLNTALAGEDRWLGSVRFFLSGSEANDAALSLAQALTGRQALVTRERAYHGFAGLAREATVQPHWHGGLSSARGVRAVPRLAEMRQLPMPGGARFKDGGEVAPSVPSRETLERTLRDSAAVLLDYSQGGVYHDPDYQDAIATAAEKLGTLWIADEVVTGFGRVGGWFAFQGGRTRPDMITLGKPLAAGAAGAGALVISRQVLEELEGATWQSYSTFRGHPLMVAAVAAHIEVSAAEGLTERAGQLDSLMLVRLTGLANRHPSIARVDGRGLHWTIELHGPDWRDWRGQESEPLASQVAARALEAGALIATSGEQTSLFLAPPLIVDDADLERMFQALDYGLELADRKIGTSGTLEPGSVGIGQPSGRTSS